MALGLTRQRRGSRGSLTQAPVRKLQATKRCMSTTSRLRPSRELVTWSRSEFALLRGFVCYAVFFTMCKQLCDGFPRATRRSPACPLGCLFVNDASHCVHRYQPQRALDLFTSWIGSVKSTAPSTDDSGATSTTKTAGKEEDLSAHAPRAPSQNPYSWSSVVDALVGDDAFHLPVAEVPRGRNPPGASRATDEVKVCACVSN